MNLFRRLYRASVWAPGAIGEDDERVRYLIGVGFPWSNACFVLFGIAGAIVGNNALDDTFNPLYSHVWSVLLAVTSFLAAVGLAYPARMWRFEFWGRIVLCVMLGLYGVALAYAGIQSGNLGRGGVAFLPLAGLGPQMWRVADVYRDAVRYGWK